MNDIILSGGGDVDLILVNRMQRLTNNITELPWANRGMDRGPDSAKRDINKECGYPDTREIGIDMLLEMYDRESIATRVVEVMPKESWKVQPAVYEDEDSETDTPFELAWDALGNTLRGQQSWYQDEEGNPVWEHLQRADKLSRIGSYGAILLGFDDGQTLATPLPGFGGDWGGTVETFFGSVGTDAQYDNNNMAVAPFVPKTGKQLTMLYMRSYHQGLVQIVQYEANRNNPRFGQPVMYRITYNDPRDQASGIGIPLATLNVHWSRVIHLADNLGSSEIFGVPAMRPVFNQLLNLRKIYGGSAEMYWQAAMNLLFLETHPALGGDVTIDQSAIKSMADKMMNGLQRWGALQGMSAKQIGPAVQPPNNHVDVAIDAIAALIGIPKRILMGSERGELASSQDDTTWNDRLMHRQQNYLTPRVIVPFIDRLIAVGVLPEPSGYTVSWPDLNVLSPLEQGQLAGLRVTAYAGYIGSGCDVLVPPQDFLTRDVGLTDEEAEATLENAAEHLAEAVPDATGEVVPGREPAAAPQPGEPGSDEFDEMHQADLAEKKAKTKAVGQKKPTANRFLSNSNPNHDQYGRFSSAATVASEHASKTGKASDHSIASGAHTLAAAYAPDHISEADHLTKANEHEQLAGSSPRGYKFKTKHLLYKAGAMLDKYDIPHNYHIGGRIANQLAANRDVSDEPRDDHGRWTLTGSIGHALGKLKPTGLGKKIKEKAQHTKEKAAVFGHTVHKEFIGKDEYQGRKAQRLARANSEFYRKNPEKLAEVIDREEKRAKGVKKDKLQKTGSFLGQVIGTATTEHIKATADEIVKASLSKADKAAKAKLDKRIRVYGTQGKDKKPLGGGRGWDEFNSIESFNKIKDNNKIIVEKIEKVGDSGTSEGEPKTKVSKRVKQHLRGLAGQTIKAVKQHAPEVAEQTVKDFITKAITAVIMAKFTGNEIVVNEQDPATKELIEQLIPHVVNCVSPAVPVGKFTGGSLGVLVEG